MGKESMQNRKPMILVLAGPNGSGKSTITTFFDKAGKSAYLIIIIKKCKTQKLQACPCDKRLV